MASVYINDIEWSDFAVDNIVYNRNRREELDFGKITLFNTQEQRYEPFTRVTLGTEQYLIESDNVLGFKAGQWEHEITLTENIAIFATKFPVDRSFTRVPSLTIKEILTIYQTELEFYQGFKFSFDTNDTIYNEPMINKQYQGAQFMTIVYDLFRKINAIPRVYWQNDEWFLTYELYTARGSEITLDVDGQQEKVNDVDYASEVLNKTKKAINEDDNYIIFPNKTKYATPRSKSTFLKTSDLQYELDSNILGIFEVIAHYPVFYYAEDDGLLINEYIDVDITEYVVSKDVYDTLETFGSPNIEKGLLYEDPVIKYKNNHVYYTFGNNLIEGLYWTTNKALLSFTANVFALRNACKYACYQWYIDNYDGVTSYFPDEGMFPENIDTEDIQIRIKYRPERDIDFIAEKQDITNFNKVTISNSQKESSSELSRAMENSSAIINRIGNKVIEISDWFDDIANAWVLGDYAIIDDEVWLVTNIKYVLYKGTKVQAIAELNKNFSNTNRESGVTREPSSFLYTGDTIQSNYIYKQYLCFYEGTTEQQDDSNLGLISKLAVMNLFDYDPTYNTPLTNLTFRRIGDTKYIDMPVYRGGGGNTILFHVATRSGIIAGNRLKKINEAWYKDPIYYTDIDDNFSLGSAEIKLSTTYNAKTDTTTIKYYPEVWRENNVYFESLILPLDKDPNNTLAITYEIVVFSESKDFIITNGFAKYNNLIREYETTPTIKLYSNTSPYTILDKKAIGTEISGLITLTGTQLIVTDALGDPIQYWAIVYNNEIIVAGNNYLTTIKYIFSNDRKITAFSSDVSVDVVMTDEFLASFTILSQLTEQVDLVMTDEFTTSYSLLKQKIYIIDVIMADEFTTNYSVLAQENLSVDIIMTDSFSTQYSITTQDIIQVDVVMTDSFSTQYGITTQETLIAEVTMTDEFEVSYGVTKYALLWVSSDVTYWNEQDALGNAYTEATASNPSVSPDEAATSYTLGDAMRCSDGSLPTTYYYYKVDKTIS